MDQSNNIDHSIKEEIEEEIKTEASFDEPFSNNETDSIKSEIDIVENLEIDAEMINVDCVTHIEREIENCIKTEHEVDVDITDIKPEQITIEMEADEVNKNYENYLQDKQGIGKEMHDTIEEIHSDIQIDIPFVDCKMEPDNGANSPGVQMNQCIKENSDTFVQNVASIHEEISKFECKLCHYRTNKKCNLTQHLKSHYQMVKSINKGVNFDCKLCDYKTNRKFYLTQHVKSIHEGITFDCKQCEYKANRKDYLLQHVKSVHVGVKYLCKYCNHKASAPSSLNRHIKLVHKAKNKINPNYHVKSTPKEITSECQKCELCDFKTKKEDELALSTLRYHVKTVHKGIQ